MNSRATDYTGETRPPRSGLDIVPPEHGMTIAEVRLIVHAIAGLRVTARFADDVRTFYRVCGALTPQNVACLVSLLSGAYSAEAFPRPVGPAEPERRTVTPTCNGSGSTVGEILHALARHGALRPVFTIPETVRTHCQLPPPHLRLTRADVSHLLDVLDFTAQVYRQQVTHMNVAGLDWQDIVDRTNDLECGVEAKR
jgi:hypothetical protein